MTNHLKITGLNVLCKNVKHFSSQTMSRVQTWQGNLDSEKSGFAAMHEE